MKKSLDFIKKKVMTWRYEATSSKKVLIYCLPFLVHFYTPTFLFTLYKRDLILFTFYSIIYLLGTK